jgi:type II restriction/modification system DNA methylase subunit YeeA
VAFNQELGIISSSKVSVSKTHQPTFLSNEKSDYFYHRAKNNSQNWMKSFALSVILSLIKPPQCIVIYR